MPKPDHNPTLAQLALQYGTITQAQFNQLSTLLSGRSLSPEKEAEVLLKQGLATRYQVGLLTLIREYQIIRKMGEEFGRLAVKKGFASEGDIRSALDIQREAFRQTRLKKLIGDILVESKIISADQKLIILKEQTRLAEKSKQPTSESTEGKQEKRRFTDSAIDLSSYEKDFLKIKALDRDFSAALIEKGMASETDISHASALQEDAFEKENTIRILGDIMVDLNMISPEQREIILQEQGRLEERQDEQRIKIVVTTDKMAAWAHIASGNRAVEIGELLRAADVAGIKTGLYPDAILQGALDAGLNSIPLANKDYSMALRDAQKLTSYAESDLSEKGEKKKGDILAAFDLTSAFVPCENIHGQTSEKGSDRDFTIRSGAGTRLSRDKTKILALKTGQPALSIERCLYIHPTVNVLEDVDLRYGPTEAYANLTVSGVVTGAYPIKAGSIKAREIRGARIDAIGDIFSEVGITDSVIRCQGDLTARYLHNCRLDIAGNLYIKNEIFDSEIACGGKIDSPSCRAVSSDLSAKKGVVLAGAGSDRTVPCRIAAGTEKHLFKLVAGVLSEIESVKKAYAGLEEKKEEARLQARKLFEKMAELKIFYDRAKRTKQVMVNEFKTKGRTYSPKRVKNLGNLMHNFDGRMEKAIQSLKELNRAKKKYDLTVATLIEKKAQLRPKIDRQILDLEQTLFAYLEWARSESGIAEIKITGKAYQGTVFKGVWAEKTLDMDMDAIFLSERDSTQPKLHIESSRHQPT